MFGPQFLKKLNRQERVVEEVKLVLKPHYNKKRVTKEQYKDILRRAVPKVMRVCLLRSATAGNILLTIWSSPTGAGPRPYRRSQLVV